MTRFSPEGPFETPPVTVNPGQIEAGQNVGSNKLETLGEINRQIDDAGVTIERLQALESKGPLSDEESAELNSAYATLDRLLEKAEIISGGDNADKTI